MEDGDIIQLYWERKERAISETDKKYGRYCYRIAYNILQNNEDSEECVSDTYLKTWSCIPDLPESVISIFRENYKKSSH